MVGSLNDFHYSVVLEKRTQVQRIYNTWTELISINKLAADRSYRLATETMRRLERTHTILLLAAAGEWYEEIYAIEQNAFSAFTNAFGALKAIDMIGKRN